MHFRRPEFAEVYSTEYYEKRGKIVYDQGNFGFLISLEDLWDNFNMCVLAKNVQGEKVN